METERLFLRNWIDDDLDKFANLNADPEVMEFFPNILTRQESDRLAQKIRQNIELNGWGPWAVELKSTGEFIGVVGLQESDKSLPFSPCVEVAWRLAKPYWGKGYASEAAKACLVYAKTVLKIREVVSFTAVKNVRSQAVMAKIGMHTEGYEFDHPDVPYSSQLCRHILYKIHLN
ncbi:MAG: N-acetyltransferase [Ketobacter sp.]|nr:MAG: N-acetyltransferase [Ketobacter sp.]